MLSRVFDEFGPRSELHASNPFLLSVARASPPRRFAPALLRALTWPIVPLYDQQRTPCRHRPVEQQSDAVSALRRLRHATRRICPGRSAIRPSPLAIGSSADGCRGMSERMPVIGCWPGRSFEWNAFVQIFCDSLEAAGCKLVDVRDPRRLTADIDVLHIHWPDQLFWAGRAIFVQPGASIRRCARSAGSRARGVRIVWMVHNLKPHELGPVRALLWKWLSSGIAKLADGFMTLSPATIAIVRRTFPRLAGKPTAFAWHPAYPRLADIPARAICREALVVGDGESLLVFLGLIRPYKASRS